MRGIRIAAFAAVAVLTCVILSHILSVQSAPALDSEDLSGPPPDVPPPPALPKPPVLHVVTPQPAPARIEAPLPVEPEVPSDGKPIIIEAEAGPFNDAPPAVVGEDPPPVQTAFVEEPKAPVIVVPHERPKQTNRGVRWLKAIGRVLGLGLNKSPEAEAFR